MDSYGQIWVLKGNLGVGEGDEVLGKRAISMHPAIIRAVACALKA